MMTAKQKPADVLFDLPFEDMEMLESLVKSPAFGALKRAIGQYRASVESQMLTVEDPHRIFNLQGQLVGLRVTENLPGLIVRRKTEIEKREELKRQTKVEGERQKKEFFGERR